MITPYRPCFNQSRCLNVKQTQYKRTGVLFMLYFGLKHEYYGVATILVLN